MKGSPTQGFAMSSAEAEKYAAEQTAKTLQAFEYGAHQYSLYRAGGFNGYDPYMTAFPNGPLREAGLAAFEAAKKLGRASFTLNELAPALVEFQVGQSKKAAAQAKEWSDTLLNGIKNGGVNIDKAVESLWRRAQVQAFTVPVIGSVTLADLRSDAFNVDNLKNAFDDIKWDDVSKQIIAGLAPEGGLQTRCCKPSTRFRKR